MSFNPEISEQPADLSVPAAFPSANAPIVHVPQAVPNETAQQAPPNSLEAVEETVGGLIQNLGDSIGVIPSSRSAKRPSAENRLVMARLGIASSLFFALRSKHSPTAAQSLRVALTCSAWSDRLGFDETTRNRIEIASVLHNIGKIGIPDRILGKPGTLTHDERLTVDLTPELGTEILRGCINDEELLDIVRYRFRWFEGRRSDDGPSGDALPMGSRMLSIAGAFDAMIHDAVYRQALPRETALGELYRGSGTQFDPELVNDFVRMLEDRPEIMHGSVANRWLHGLKDNRSNAAFDFFGQREHSTKNETPTTNENRDDQFFEHWLDNTRDGVLITDVKGIIRRYNRQMASLVGVDAWDAIGDKWQIFVEDLEFEIEGERKRNSKRFEIAKLVEVCLATQESLTVRGKFSWRKEKIPIEIDASPIKNGDPKNSSVMIQFRDLSNEHSLQRKVDTLKREATTDPLTKVANRALLDRTILELIEKSKKKNHLFSIIICDIDHFKNVNDIHGHQAGDEALVEFAKVLTKHSREQDLVARYGGEEFVVVCRECDNASAARRAEVIRETLERTSLSSLGGQSVTASFGVTEFQPGDTAETIVTRADRALLKAKENGRNRVIQVGSGNQMVENAPEPKTGWMSWLTGRRGEERSDFDLVSPVPADLVIEKIRGFIADHRAEIVDVSKSQVVLRVKVNLQSGGRRMGDDLIYLKVKLVLSAYRGGPNPKIREGGTNIHVHLEPVRSRDRRLTQLSSCFEQVSKSLQSYLMAVRPDQV